ncbi:hypothetical protein [Bacillus sp. JJ1764]|uniref:hypothetical protein n=1 Tax=Bacillus sp. JJ1764 TaxID=3122964 RepID=UPI002FFEC5DF
MKISGCYQREIGVYQRVSVDIDVNWGNIQRDIDRFFLKINKMKDAKNLSTGITIYQRV